MIVLLSRSIRPSTLCGLIVGAGLIILGRGNGSLMEMSTINLSFRGGGVDVIVCDDTAWLGVLGCLLPVDGAGVVLGEPLVCMPCVVWVARWTACCNSLRRRVISFHMLLPFW